MSESYPNVIVNGEHVLYLNVRDNAAGKSEINSAQINHVTVVNGTLVVEIDSEQE
jgi:hypothetical protein